MNKYAEARTRLVEALEEVLPGRVFPYEPSSSVPMGIWIGVALPSTRSAGNSSTVKTVALPIVISFDGDTVAQIAGLDETVAKVEDAIANLAGARLLAARFVDSPDDRSKSTVVIDIDISTGVRSICPPTVEEAEVPPPIVQRIA